VKINGEWAAGVIYANKEKPEEIYVRSKEDFDKNFREFE